MVSSRKSSFEERNNVFQVGDKVWCIEGGLRPDPRLPYMRIGITTPIEGEIYTVREVCKTYTDSTGVRLQEIQNLIFKDIDGVLYEPTFDVDRFTLVIRTERSDDI